MGLLSLVLLTWLGAAPNGPILPNAPVRFVAAEDGLLHVSLHRSYREVPGNLTVTEADGHAWDGEALAFTPENTQTHPGVAAFRYGRVTKGRTYELRATQPGEIDAQFFSQTQTVEAGMSWLIRAADAWLSNQPRQGAIAQAGQIQHPEARACVACHITQFSTRAYLTASLNGYPAPDTPALGAVMNRLRENPRPLYGHPGVNWARVIHSARTVSSRLPVLLSMHRQATSTSGTGGDFDRELTLSAARFLELSDECGLGLRPEADGSRPDVSGFEIGWQTAQTFRIAALAEPSNPKWPAQAACVEGQLHTKQPANVIDAAWRIVALAKLGQPTTSAITELLRYQQADGRFALEFSKTAPPADFISYHVLYALAVAKYQGPAVDRLAAYTRRQQRPDGSWKGAPEYKGFDTPFRETQFAVMALSELAPQKFTPFPTEKPSPRREESPSVRSILSRLANDERLGNELSASLDENLSQLREWQRIIRQPAEQAKVEQALRAESQQNATLLADSLRTGSRTLRLRILTALSTMVGQGFARRPRVGNDVEPPQILADAGGALERQLLSCLDPQDPELTRAAIRAGTAMSDVLTPAFTTAMLRLMPHFGAEIVEAYGQGGRGRLSLSRGDSTDLELVALVRQALEVREPRTLSVLLPLLSALEPGHRFTREPSLAGPMEFLLRDRPEGEILQAAGVFPSVVDGPLMRAKVMAGLVAKDPAVVRAAVDVVLERYLVNPRVVELTLQYLSASRGLARRMLLDSLDPNRLTFNLNQVTAYSPPPIPIPLDGSILSAPFIQDFVLSSLTSEDAQVQAAALDVTHKQAVLRRNSAIQKAMVAAPRHRLVSDAAKPEELLDFEFFRQRIHPILVQPGPDGRSCAMCHASNARFTLRNDVRANYRAVAGKVSVADPVASPLLVKPLLPSVASDGDVFRTAHNGGQRWPYRTGSAEYQAILEWIRGARATVSDE